jgi:vitellogenic carboxypeptidase-like protein
MAIGNSFTDPPVQILEKPQLAFDFGLISPAELDMLNIWAQNASKLALAGDYDDAFDIRTKLEGYVINNSLVNPYDVREFTQYNFTDIITWANLNNTKTWLNVPLDNVYGTVPQVAIHLKSDEMRSVKALYPRLLQSGLKILLYQGQFDWRDGAAANQAWIRTIDWPGRGGFDNATRKLWLDDDGAVAGFTRSYQNLCEIVVVDAGHLVPLNQPTRSKTMITRFLRDDGLC